MKNIKLSVIAILAIFTIAGNIFAVPVQWSENGHWYEAVATDLLTWSQAKLAAEQTGGYLVTLTSASENTFVYNLIKDNDSFWNEVNGEFGPWIGAYQLPSGAEPAGGWTWVTGEAWTYNGFASGQPSNSGGDQEYAHYWASPARSYTWNDLADVASVKAYIIEWNNPVPEPTTLITAILFCVGLFIIKRSHH